MSELVDQFGRPIQPKELLEDLTSPVSGVRDIWHDSTATNLTPSKLAMVLLDLRDGEVLDFLTLAEEMEEREAHYSSVIGTRKNALAGLEPVVEAASDEKANVDLADDLRAFIDRPEFSFLVEDLLDALSKGFSAAEIRWETSAKQWMPREFRWTDPRWFQFNKKTMELRLRDPEVQEGVALAPYKWIVHYPRLKAGFPVSGGLARIAAVSFMCKNYTLKDWMRFVEIYGMPLRVGRYGPNATPKDKAILKRAVINIGADAAAIIPDSMKIEFEKGVNQNAGMTLYRGTAEWLDRQMSKAVLGQTASTEGTPGKLGGDDAQDDVRRDILRKDARTCAATLNQHLVRPYIDLNYGPQERYPAIKWIIKDPEDTKSLAESVGVLVDRGLRVKQSEMRDKLGLSDPADDDEVLVSSSESANGPAAPAASAVNAARGRKTEDGRLKTDRNGQNRMALNAQGDGDDVVDELEALALDGWEPAMQPVLNALQELADACGDADEFKRRLPEVVDSADLSELTRSLAMAMFTARGAGDSDEN